MLHAGRRLVTRGRDKSDPYRPGKVVKVPFTIFAFALLLLRLRGDASGPSWS